MTQLSETSTVFVTSATGSQGGALCRELPQLGWNVRATAPLHAALSGCDKLLLYLFPNLTDLDQAPQRAHGIVTIAKGAGVRQLGALMIEKGTQPPVPLDYFFTRHL